MSEKEAAVEAPEPKAKKKKGKLPMLLALVAVLGGGGFFAMKMKGGGAKPKVALGEILPLEQEFLSNLKDPETYVRAKIALHLEKGFDKAKLADKLPAIEDAIYMILSQKSLSQVRSYDGKMALKAEIAASVNVIAKADAAHPEGKSASMDAKKEEKASAAEEKGGAARAHPDWDSDTGPILKVYFQSFATQ